MTAEDQDRSPSRRRALLTAVVWSFIFGLIAYAFAVAAALSVGLAVTSGLEAASDWLATVGPTQIAVQGVAALGGGILATYLVGIRRFGMTGSDLRWRTSWSPPLGFGTGLLYGVVPALGVFVAAAVLGDVRWVGGLGARAGAGAVLLAGSRVTLGLAPAAIAEEVLFRGVPIVLVAVAVGRGWAIGFVGGVFGLAHVFNPNVTAMGVANVALAGILLGTVFYGRGGLWAAFGAHLGWNATLALSGTAVSGIPFEVSYLKYEAGGPDWLTGGPFGPEGGLLATMMLGLAVIVAARQVRSRDD